MAGSTVVAGVGTAGLALASPAGAAGSTSSGMSCPATQGLSIAFSGTLSNTNAKFGSAATVSGVSGSLCGTLDLTTSTATIQPNNFVFNPTSTKLYGFLSLPTTLAVTAPTTATLSPTATGAYNTSMSVSMLATASILGLFTCNIGPITPTMTTGQSGSVSGTPLTGSVLTQLKGTLAAGDFSVPKITPSSQCPSFIAGIADLLMGLPLAPGKSTITSTVTMAPGSPTSSTSGSTTSSTSGSGTSGFGGGWGFQF